MIFDYLRTTTALDSIDIEDIGNCCINALNDSGEEWFLVIRTWEGWTEITDYGPLLVDSDQFSSYFVYNKYGYDFSEKKISTAIDKFLNNPKRVITQVYEVEKEFAKERLDMIRNKL